MKLNKLNNKIVSVMYHYVRDLKTSKYKNIKFLEYKNFIKQIKFFKKNFNIINPNEVLSLNRDRKIYNKPFLILTFDDGYSDHYDYVSPTLIDNKIQGLFFLPSRIFKANSVLEVNKIQFILSEVKEKKKLLVEILDYLKRNYNLNYTNKIKIKTLRSSRYDENIVIIIKRLLQYLLPKKIRTNTINFYFRKYVTKDLLNFKKKLYLTEKQVVEMKNANMIFGSHSDNHEWMEFMSYDEQKKEVRNSDNFLEKKFKFFKNDFKSFCYPYGSYNKKTIDILKQFDYKMAFTTDPKPFLRNKSKNILELPRYDTNDFKVLD